MSNHYNMPRCLGYLLEMAPSVRDRGEIAIDDYVKTQTKTIQEEYDEGFWEAKSSLRNKTMRKWYLGTALWIWGA